MKFSDAYWMNRCLSLSRKGMGKVSPNPLVGAVIVKNGKKIGEGFHRSFGGAHAEINAIRDARKRKHDLNGATIYVNLEPCSHQGKTPPCVDALIKYRFHRVVIAMQDPNPLVAGKGIMKLREHGIQCVVGIRAAEARRLNEHFIKFITTHTPFVAIKAAQTNDAFIARLNGRSKWITNVRSRALSHRLRTEYDAVLVGAHTVRMDDPKLTVRMVNGRNPVRIVLDGKLSSEPVRKIFSRAAKTIVYADAAFEKCEAKKIRQLRQKGVEVVLLKGIQGRINIHHVLTDLGKRNIASVLVEGGQQMYTTFMNAKCVDKLWLFTSPKKFHQGIKTFDGISVSFKRIRGHTKQLSTDTLNEYDIVFP